MVLLNNRCYLATGVSLNLLLLISVVIITNNHQVSACTAILVGRKATVDGSVFASHSDDGEGNNDPRIMYIPEEFHSGNDKKREVMPDTEDFPRYVGYSRGPDYYPTKLDDPNTKMTIPIGSIPQVSNKTTYSYFDGTSGVMNSKQLIVGGESTCSGIFFAKASGNGGKALLSIIELSRIALERTSKAREAIQLMGDLAEKYGFYGPSGSFEGSAESLMVADPYEAFVFHILPDDTGTSAIWVAKRVPDDEVTIVTNMFTIREVNLTDTYNYLGTKYMYKVAERNNLWKQRHSDQLLDFTKTFSNGEYAHKYYSGRRIWGAFRLLAPSLNLDPEYDDLKEIAAYPWSIKPDRLLTLEDVFDVHRNYYQGTQFDLSTGLAAGPFGDPDRLNVGHKERRVIQNKYDGMGAFERPIALFRTTYTTVMQARHWLDDSIGGVMWLGTYAPHGTCFLPFSVGVNSLPSSITEGSMVKLDRKTAFWTFRYMHTLSRLRYSDLSKVIHEAQKRWEGVAFELQKQLENEPITPSAESLTEIYSKHTANVLDAWWKMADELVFMYADGFNNRRPNAPEMGYSAEWLEAVGYQNGPPPPPQYKRGKTQHYYYDWTLGETIGVLTAVLFLALLTVRVFNERFAFSELVGFSKRDAKHSVTSTKLSPYATYNGKYGSIEDDITSTVTSELSFSP